MASTANISAFALGSGIGLYLGGAAIAGGLRLLSVNWIGGLMTTSGLGLAAMSLRRQRSSGDPTRQGQHGGQRAHHHDSAGVHVH